MNMAIATSERAQEALFRAAEGRAWTNYPLILQGFLDKGIPESEIKPRENVFTFHAWKALGRTVKRGEHGVKVLTFAPTTRKERDSVTGEDVVIEGKRPWSATVFHVSQTKPIGEDDHE